MGGCIARHTVAGLDLDAGAESYATATPAVRRSDPRPRPGIGDRGAQPGRRLGAARPRDRSAADRVTARYPVPAVRRRCPPRAGSGRIRPGVGRSGAPGRRRPGSGDRPSASARWWRTDGPIGGRTAWSSRSPAASTRPIPTSSTSTRCNPGCVPRCGRPGHCRRRSDGCAVAATGPDPPSAGCPAACSSWWRPCRRSIEALGGTIDTGTDVQSVTWDDRGWLIQTSTGTRIVPQVVLAVPGPAAADLLGGAGISAPTTATSDVVLVTLVVDHAGLDAHPRGTGVLVSRHATGVTAKALTHATAKWAWLAERGRAGTTRAAPVLRPRRRAAARAGETGRSGPRRCVDADRRAAGRLVAGRLRRRQLDLGPAPAAARSPGRDEPAARSRSASGRDCT